MIWGQVIAAYQADIDALKQEHAFLEQEIGPRLTAYGERIQSLWQAIKGDLRVSVLCAGLSGSSFGGGSGIRLWFV